MSRRSGSKGSAPTTASGSEKEPPAIDLLTGIRTGQLAAAAQGRSDGRITLSLKNQTDSKLRVILPPGLMVSGVSGQFGGGMGGMGGGMGGGWAVEWAVAWAAVWAAVWAAAWAVAEVAWAVAWAVA